ncbi:magnesium transporter [Actinomadura craniellae]|uniref:Magnesium transporter n=2 Tax=Actinomadura craniellae TaxID=2231787 RepID=A0A365GZR0_9ACTN|nr:magnesium transporter [Actinomadura craniellae]
MWRDGALVAEGFPVAEVSDRLAEPGTTVWLDLCGPERSELDVISAELGLHGLAVEDAVSRHERARLDRYPEYLFLNVYSTEGEGDGQALREVSAFVTPRALVTVRQGVGFDVDALVGHWDAHPDLARYGVSYLLHGLLDLVVDRHVAAIQALDDESEALEDLLFSADSGASMRELQRRSFELRKNLVRVRKAVLPMRDIVVTLLRRDVHAVEEPMLPYFQDVYDHALHAIERTDSLRDMIANLLETRISLQDTQRNEVMKKVTSWAGIIAVPTAITGFYGQNVPYPGRDQYWGFLTGTAIMVASSLVLYVIFKLRDWL